MRKTVSTVLSAVASFILILCIIFTCIGLVMNDDVFMESELKKTDTAKSMGMSVADQARALHRLTDFMQGRAESIDVEVTVNGELVPMYALEIEHTHMDEVQKVWLNMTAYRNMGLAIAVAFYILAMLAGGRGSISAFMRGYLFGLAGIALFGAFIGTWAAADFSAFWTFFHKLIFPASSNWLLPIESRMIQMLPQEFFADVIVRICIFALAAIAVLGIGATITLIVNYKKKGKAEPVIEEPIEIIEPEGPDLITEYKKRNLPVSKRDSVEAEGAAETETETEPESEQ